MAQNTQLTAKSTDSFFDGVKKRTAKGGDVFVKCWHGNEREKCELCVEANKQHQKMLEREEEQERQWAEELRIKREERPHEILKEANIPVKFIRYSFDDFQGGDVIKKICDEFIERYKRNVIQYDGGVKVDHGILNYPGSILLTGGTGSGKTHIAISILRELIKLNKIYRSNVCFITAPEFLLEIRNTFNKKVVDFDEHEPKTEEEIIDKYAGCELLILDDLGAEKSSDFAIQSLYLLIDRRNRNLKPTIITTNLSLKEIEEKLDARIASRLSDMKVIKINMPDYRKKR
jgi:DNA replication protein DnaC